jgi:2-amino-4-hydroxy-6-hydroxymethyldihydropteridine diphosphokinase
MPQDLGMAAGERAYIGLGANLGDAATNLARAVRALAALPGSRLRAVSRLYRTTPVGVADQPDFLNAVVELDVPTGPDPEIGALALLEALKHIERAVGRQPRRRWGPREVDLDLLLFGEHQLDARRPDDRWLTVPHPGMGRRLFVLAPLAELAPELHPAGWSQSIEAAREERMRVEGPGAVAPIGEWNPTRREWISLPGAG